MAEKFVNYYDLMQISEKASDEVIKAAYRALSKKYHPDGDTPDVMMMQRINTAYEILSDEGRRRRYDLELHAYRQKILEVKVAAATEATRRAGKTTGAGKVYGNPGNRKTSAKSGGTYTKWNATESFDKGAGNAADSEAARKAEAERKREEARRAAEERERAYKARKEEEAKRKADADRIKRERAAEEKKRREWAEENRRNSEESKRQARKEREREAKRRAEANARSNVNDGAANSNGGEQSRMNESSSKFWHSTWNANYSARQRGGYAAATPEETYGPHADTTFPNPDEEIEVRFGWISNLLHNRQFADAERSLRAIKDSVPRDPRVHVGLLLAQFKLRRFDELATLNKRFDESEHYNNAVYYADEVLAYALRKHAFDYHARMKEKSFVFAKVPEFARNIFKDDRTAIFVCGGLAVLLFLILLIVRM